MGIQRLISIAFHVRFYGSPMGGLRWRRHSVDANKEIEEIRDTLRILDEKVGEVSRSIRAYVDFLTEKRLEEGLEEFQEQITRRLAGLESRIEALEKTAGENKQP
jgi:LPS O-antigen subunit length determinant protein (WzzB/FepE family)